MTETLAEGVRRLLSAERAAQRGELVEPETRGLAYALRRTFIETRAGVLAAIRRDVGLGEARRLSASQWDPLLARVILRSEPAQREAVRRAAGRALWRGAERLGSDVGALVSFDVPDPVAADYLRARGAELVARVSETTRRGLAALLERSVESGLSAARIAAELRDSYDLSWSRATTIARTETAAAFSEGTLVGARRLAATGTRTEKAWLVNEPEDVGCVENGRSDWRDLAEPFPSGHQRPPVHPNCECDVIYRAA